MKNFVMSIGGPTTGCDRGKGWRCDALLAPHHSDERGDRDQRGRAQEKAREDFRKPYQLDVGRWMDPTDGQVCHQHRQAHHYDEDVPAILTGGLVPLGDESPVEASFLPH